MKIVMKKNLGRIDAGALGVDFENYTVTGQPVDAPEAVAKVLLARKLAAVVSDATAKVEPLKAVPEPAVAARPATPAVKGK